MKHGINDKAVTKLEKANTADENSIDVDKYKCKKCGKLSLCKYSHQLHVKTHFGKKSIKSVIYGKSCNQNAHLQSHVKTHTGDKPYNCDVCNKSFAWSCQLKKC